MISLGQHPAPSHVIAHVSDTHLLGGGRLLYDTVETEVHLRAALAQLEHLGTKPNAIVFTGDLADLGEPDAYARLKAIVEPAAAKLGASIIWVMGNHDDRGEFSSQLLGEEASQKPQDRVYDVDGLRVISLDTSVPGFHHGALTGGQLEWLAAELATPAEHGTLLALHHPPLPTPMLWAMEMLELHDQARLAAVLTGTDVRGILGGHLHYTTHGSFAGIPVSVAAATCYTINGTVKDRLLSGSDANQAINMVHVYDDNVVHTVVPIGVDAEITSIPSNYIELVESLTFEQRLAIFSDKESKFNRGLFDPANPTA